MKIQFLGCDVRHSKQVEVTSSVRGIYTSLLIAPTFWAIPIWIWDKQDIVFQWSKQLEKQVSIYCAYYTISTFLCKFCSKWQNGVVNFFVRPWQVKKRRGDTIPRRQAFYTIARLARLAYSLIIGTLDIRADLAKCLNTTSTVVSSQKDPNLI